MTGTKIIRESPVLVWDKDNWMELLAKFEVLPDVMKEGVLDMYFFPLDSHQLLPFKYEITQCARVLGMDETLAMKLLSISMANSHDYFGHTDVRYQEIVGHDQSHLLKSKQCALYLYASKVSHSCHPNTSYTSKTDDGKMVYKAIQEIAAGDMVTFSYIGDVWSTPTHIRRGGLQDARSFLCKCTRCVKPDWLRLIKCKRCHKGLLTCTYDDEGSPNWTCQSCNEAALNIDCKASEDSMSNKISLNEMQRLESLSVSDLKSTIRQIEKELSPLHFLSLKAQNQFVKICASKACHIEQNIDMISNPQIKRKFLQHFGDPRDLRSEVAKFAIKVVLAIECIAAECYGCSHKSSMQHVAVYEAAIIMFHCSQDLMKCPERLWPANAKLIVQKYVPLMKIQFGEDDEDVADIERKIIGVSSALSELSQDLQAMSMPSEGARASSNNTGKKKGKKKSTSTKKKKGRGK